MNYAGIDHHRQYSHLMLMSVSGMVEIPRLAGED